MACNKVYFSMSYGILPVHHLEQRVERRIPFVRSQRTFHIPVWNNPLPEEELSRIEHKIREAFSALDVKYKYAVDGKVKIHPRSTSVGVRLGVEDELKEQIFMDYFELAGTPDYFDNVELDFLNRTLQPYEKRLEGFKVVDLDAMKD